MIASHVEQPSRTGQAPEPTANGHAKPGRTPPAPPGAAANGHAAPSETAANGDGREAKTGRFAAGNKCGKGNPFARRLGAMRSAFLDAVSAEGVQALARKLLAQALAGDVQAAQLFLAYAVGKPAPAADPDALDLAEWQLLARSPSRAEMSLTAIDAVPPALAAAIAGLAMPKESKQATALGTDPRTIGNIRSLSSHRHHGKKV